MTKNLVAVVTTHNYIFVPAFWDGKDAFLNNIPREQNPHTENQEYRLAWWIGWDDEAEILKGIVCEHHTFNETNEFCTVCGWSKSQSTGADSLA